MTMTRLSLIRHSVDADKDSGYKGAAAPSNIDVAVKDNEAPGVVVSRTSLSVEEGGRVTYTVSLTKAPTDTEAEVVMLHLAGTGVNLSPGVFGIRKRGNCSEDDHGDWPHGQQ